MFRRVSLIDQLVQEEAKNGFKEPTSDRRITSKVDPESTPEGGISTAVHRRYKSTSADYLQISPWTTRVIDERHARMRQRFSGSPEVILLQPVNRSQRS